MQTNSKIRCVLASLIIAASSAVAEAENWSNTEVHLQYGNLDKAFQGGGRDAETGASTTLTFQHASAWDFGTNFFFIDHLDYGKTDAEKAAGRQSDDEFYGEWYSSISLTELLGKNIALGPVTDLGLIAGFNFAAEADTLYYLPGVRLSLDIPGFAFANLDVMAYLQNGSGNAGADIRVSDDDSFIVDFNWAYPFTVGASRWSLEGHIEYIRGADQELRIAGVGVTQGKRQSWILAQPQLRLDLGELIGAAPDRFFVGLEYQFWQNKLGDGDSDESVVQLLAAWRF